MSATIDNSVRAGARAVIAALVGLPANKGWENTKGTPAADEEWVVENKMSSLPRQQADFGNTVNNLDLTYLYAVKIMVPKDTGPETIEGYAGILMSGLKPGTKFTAESQPVRVRAVAKTSIMYPTETPGHAVVVVTFTLHTFAANT